MGALCNTTIQLVNILTNAWQTPTSRVEKGAISKAAFSSFAHTRELCSITATWCIAKTLDIWEKYKVAWNRYTIELSQYISM